MSKPEDIPQDVWDAAVRCTGIGGGHEFAGVLDAQRQSIARAIMAAKAEEREACAKFCETQAPNMVGQLFADIIRKNGEG